jgi:hypothetical protein
MKTTKSVLLKDLGIKKVKPPTLNRFMNHVFAVDTGRLGWKPIGFFRLIPDGWLCDGHLLMAIPPKHEGKLGEMFTAGVAGKNKTREPLSIDGPKPKLDGIIPRKKPDPVRFGVRKHEVGISLFDAESSRYGREFVVRLTFDTESAYDTRTVLADAHLLRMVQKWWPKAEILLHVTRYSETIVAYEGDRCVMVLMPLREEK